MGTIVLYAIIAVVVAAAIVALLVVVLPDERLQAPVRDSVPLGLPLGAPVDAEHVNRLRLPVTMRGYRMVDTDAVLDRLSSEIERRDREIADLREAYDRAVQPITATGFAPAGEQVALDDDQLALDDEHLDLHPAGHLDLHPVEHLDLHPVEHLDLHPVEQDPPQADGRATTGES